MADDIALRGTSKEREREGCDVAAHSSRWANPPTLEQLEECDEPRSTAPPNDGSTHTTILETNVDGSDRSE